MCLSSQLSYDYGWLGHLIGTVLIPVCKNQSRLIHWWKYIRLSYGRWRYAPTQLVATGPSSSWLFTSKTKKATNKLANELRVKQWKHGQLYSSVHFVRSLFLVLLSFLLRIHGVWLLGQRCHKGYRSCSERWGQFRASWDINMQEHAWSPTTLSRCFHPTLKNST